MLRVRNSVVRHLVFMPAWSTCSKHLLEAPAECVWWTCILLYLSPMSPKSPMSPPKCLYIGPDKHKKKHHLPLTQSTSTNNRDACMTCSSPWFRPLFKYFQINRRFLKHQPQRGTLQYCIETLGSVVKHHGRSNLLPGFLQKKNKKTKTITIHV